MKLIIDIDDKVYNDLKNRGLTGMLTSEECECMNKSIYNGTPLEDIRTDIHRHKMHFYPSDYTFINTLIDKWINRGVDI